MKQNDVEILTHWTPALQDMIYNKFPLRIKIFTR